MRNVVSATILAILISLALTITPEEPKYVAHQVDDGNDDAIQFIGGDGKTMLTGFWFLPDIGNSTSGSPVILMAHGLGLVQGESLMPYVKEFQATGYAVFTFDYSTFGKSDGFPRHQVNPERHVADIQAALSMIKNEGSERAIDVQKIGLWGTSLGGGHVLMVAAEADPAVRAVVSQIPHIVSGAESVLNSLIQNPLETAKGLVMVGLGIIKYMASRIGNRITYLPITGPPGSAAILQNPGDEEGYLGVLNPAADDKGWRNAATADSALRVLAYRPLNSLAKVNLPVLLVAAELDTLCPAKFVEMAKDRIKNSEMLVLSNVGHFDCYQGEAFRLAMEAQLSFLNRHLM